MNRRSSGPGRSAGVGMLFVAGFLGGTGSPAAGQGLAEELRRVGDGWASLQVQVRDGVEVCDHGIRWYGPDGERRGHWHRGGRGSEICDPGPLQVDLRLLDGRVREVEAGRVSARPGAAELGERDPVEVSDYLVTMTYRDAADEAAEEGLFLSRLPQGADPTEGILRVARDREISPEVRKSGLFWAGQLATDVVVGPLRSVAVEEDGDQDIRDAAVFALSQHQGAEAVPALMELALEAPHPGTRRSALFWLAQRDDPEVAEFLADVILGRRGG